MTGTVLIVTLLAAGCAAYVLAPLFRRDAAEAERIASAHGEERDLRSKREMLLTALRDLEDDRATDKIGQEDYDDLHARLSSQAVELMKRLDALEQERREREERVVPPPIPHPKAGRSD